MTKILAIDDNNDNLITLGAIVKDFFPDVIFNTALSGTEGIELAISTDPDVILLDINMPDMDGFEVCRQLKEDERVCNIPVVFLTAMKEDRDKRIKALEVGVEAFLFKPIDETILIAQIRAMLKIKEFNNHKRSENERLLQLVAERTRELEQSQSETLELLNEQKVENEKYRNAEEELKESEELFRNIFEYHTAVKLIIDPDTGNIIDANHAAESFYGWPKEQLKQMNIQEINPIYPKELKQAMERTKTREQNHFEFCHRLADGSFRDVEVFSSRIEVKGKFLLHSIVHDISKRKRAEKAISTSELRLKRAELASSSGNWELHLESQAVYASEGAMMVYGLDKNESNYTVLKAIPLPEYRPLLNESMNKLIEEDIPYDIEFKIKTADNGIIKDIHSIATFNKEEGIVFGIIQDITERKQTEAALKESESKFHMLFDQMSEGFALHELIYDANHVAVDYKILEINPAFEKQVGITIEKAKGTLATELYGVTPAPFLDIYAQVAETGEHQFFQTYFPPLDRHFQISIFSPNPTYFATVFTDISEVKHAEEALRESEYQFKQLVDDMHVGVLLQGSQAEILLSNPTALELLDLTESQLLGRTSFDSEWNVIHEDGSPFLGSMHPVPQAIESRHSVRNVVMGVYRPTSHDRIWLLVDAEPQLNSEGAVKQVVCTFIDISERKKIEAAIKENESRLRELNATKDKFFSIISHDLKNPFNSILGLSNILVEQIQEKNFDGIEEYAAIIQKSSMQAYELLVNLLEWSRTQIGRIEFSPEYIELGALINEVAELLNDSARQKSISIFKELPRNMLVSVDKAMISSVLRNLITNAIKFTHPSGQVMISADKKPDELTISISDNGIGINKETIGRLFRIDENHIALGTQNEKGTGLGLILCKEFIEKHGGRIWVESIIGKGSTFYFTIPKV
jgi:two-component system, sensor histidine kinase and response regulator